MRQKFMFVAGLVIAMMLGMSVSVRAQSALTVEADATVASHYVWRGYDVLGGAKLPVMPSVTFAHESGFSANAWGSWALLDRSGTDGKDEIDVTLDYSRAIDDKLSASVGFIYYLFPNTDVWNTSELYAGVGYDVTGNPSLTVYYDNEWIDGSASGSGWYVSVAGEHGVNAGSLTIDLAANVGIASNSAFTGLQDFNLTASTSVPVGSVSLTPFVTTTFVFQDAVNSDAFVAFGGVSVSYAF